MAHRLTAAAGGIDLRPATDADRSFLLDVYRSTREDELALTGWSDADKDAFVEMQFAAQDRSYRQAYPDARFLVILRDGRPVGRLYLVRLADEIRVVDIALLHGHRGAGIGSALLASILADADADGLAVRLHVEPWNPARRLYERLGFRTLEQRGVYAFMERPAAGQLKTAS